MSEFNPRKIVLTESLLHQKILSANPFLGYMLSIVENNFTFEVEEMDIGLNKLIKVDRQLTGMKINDFYRDFKKTTSHPMPQTLFTKKWNILFPNNQPTYKRSCGSTHKVCINFPSIKDAQKVLNEQFKHPIFIEEEDEKEKIEIQSETDPL